MEFREALDIARRNPGATVTRGADGQFVVLREDGSPFPAPDPAKDEIERLQREIAFLLRRYDDVQSQLEEERRSHKGDVAALNAKVHQLQLAVNAGDEALAAAAKTNEQLREKIARVSPEEWARIKVHEEELRQANVRELRAERRVQNCACNGEVENCARCYGRGTYTVDGFGNPVYA